MAWTYLLRCTDGTLYCGSTTDLERRLGQHQAGQGAQYTRHRLPVELVWAAQFDSIRAAYDFEKQVQGWGRRKREALIAGRFDLLPVLASRCWSSRTSPPTLDAAGAAPPPERTMPWDEPHVLANDPDDPWAPPIPVEPEVVEEPRPLPYTRILPED